MQAIQLNKKPQIKDMLTERELYGERGFDVSLGVVKREQWRYVKYYVYIMKI